MKILAVDTSCDDSCAAIVDTEREKLLSDVVYSHARAMKAYGGVVPELASREHLKALPLSVDQALKNADLDLQAIDHFVVTSRPGLMGALLVGLSYVKALAFALEKPFSVLNHIEAHLYSPLLASLETGDAPPPFPWIALVVSGGHTELFAVEDFDRHQWLGGTLDDAAGEAFDKIGKLLSLEYPAGPRIDRWVAEAAQEEDRKRYAFPRAKTASNTFSFSGLKTAVRLQIQKLQNENALSDQERLYIAASAQEAILDALLEKVQSALESTPGARIVVTGGVACNSRLRAKLPEAYFPAPKHCTDNAAMVAALANMKAQQGTLECAPWSATPSPTADFDTMY